MGPDFERAWWTSMRCPQVPQTILDEAGASGAYETGKAIQGEPSLIDRVSLSGASLSDHSGFLHPSGASNSNV